MTKRITKTTNIQFLIVLNEPWPAMIIFYLIDWLVVTNSIINHDFYKRINSKSMLRMHLILQRNAHRPIIVFFNNRRVRMNIFSHILNWFDCIMIQILFLAQFQKNRLYIRLLRYWYWLWFIQYLSSIRKPPKYFTSKAPMPWNNPLCSCICNFDSTLMLSLTWLLLDLWQKNWFDILLYMGVYDQFSMVGANIAF